MESERLREECIVHFGSDVVHYMLLARKNERAKHTVKSLLLEGEIYTMKLGIVIYLPISYKSI